MMLCHGHPKFQHGDSKAIESVDWSAAAKNIFIAQQCQQYVHSSCDPKIDPQKLQGKQLEAHDVVQDHYHSKEHRTPLWMIISDTAGTRKSYLIKCLKKLLGDHLHFTALTGGAAYNVHGYTLHSLLGIPISGDFRDLEGQRLCILQESLAGVDFLIIDEMSMVGRKLFGQIDSRLRQAFSHK